MMMTPGDEPCPSHTSQTLVQMSSPMQYPCRFDLMDDSGMMGTLMLGSHKRNASHGVGQRESEGVEYCHQSREKLVGKEKQGLY